MPRRVRMSPVDTAWLRMDSPANLMMIVGVDVFDGPVDMARLRAAIASHLLCYREFRSRVVQDPSGTWCEDDGNFDLDHHLVRIALPGDAGKVELQKLAAQLAGQSLDAMRPLWQMHLVENYVEGHALVIRIHHCIADGIALIQVMLGLTTPDPDGELGVPPRRKRVAGADEAPWEALLRPFIDTAVKAIDATGELASKALRAYGAMLEGPQFARMAATGYARMAAQVAKDAAALALMDDDTTTSLKGKPTGTKVVAWNEPLPLADVKAVCKAIDCSVNDVLLSCAAGAIRGYLAERGEDVDGAEMRAMVPVNLRGTGKPLQRLGNKFGLVPLLLPIGIDSPIARVFEVRKRMDELKGGYTAVVAMALLGMAGLVPRAVQKQVLDLLARKATAVMTNVPGPQHALYMGGAHLKRMMFWVPQSGDIGLGVSILSYDGGVQFGLIADRKLCAEPQKIIDRFAGEFENLVHALLLMPWDEAADPQLAKKLLDATEPLAAAAQTLAGRDRPAAEPSTAGATRGRGNGHAAGHGVNGAEPTDAAPQPKRRKSAFAAARRH
ncbi:MAG TPA: wax ester/triacylglycerol synthase family O-acyltransferase [Burkholderiaceae bacterium]|nr:wax ester/triacylglycerol synthase family O-acyltransferase [Burkholderiaceae bacterium]